LEDFILGDFRVTLNNFILNSKEKISSEGLDSVLHYFNHGEYEMSLEGLVIELIASGKYPDNFNFQEWSEFAKECHLDTDSVFNDGFWMDFLKWGEDYINLSASKASNNKR
jgi:hypothetical protein